VSFKSIAQNMVQRGVHVVPTYPGLRYPALAGWQDLNLNQAFKYEAALERGSKALAMYE
jgi:hypothetical protein